MNIPITDNGPDANVPSPQPGTEWLSTGRFAALLGVLIFLAFPQVVTGFHSFVFRDYGLFGYPLAHYFRDCFWRGELPLWNPYNNCGIPFLAQWNTMVLYPPSLFYLLFPLPWSLSMFTLLHQFFGGLGMYLLACRWTGHRLAGGLAGIAFAFNGFTLNCLIWPHFTAGLAWMPWVVLFVTRASQEGGRRILTAALTGTLQMLTGAPEVILLTWLILCVLWWGTSLGGWKEVWTRGWRFAAVIALVAALAAPQLLPFFDLLPHTQRDTTYDTGRWSLHVWGWANLFVPVFRTFRSDVGVHFQPGQQFTTSYYPGLCVILLGTLAAYWVRERRVLLLAMMIIGSIVLGMGDQGYLYAWLRKGFPQFGMIRYTSKFVIVLTLAWPLLAAFGLQAVFRRSNRKNSRQHFWIVLAFAATLLAMLGGIATYARFFPGPGESWQSTLQNACMRATFLFTVIAVIWALHNASLMHLRRYWQPLFLVLISLDLMKHTPQQNPTVLQKAMTLGIVRQNFEPTRQLGKSRIAVSPATMAAFGSVDTSNLTRMHLLLRAALVDNLNLTEAIPKAEGFFPLHLYEQRLLQSYIFVSNDIPRVPLARFLGISHVASATNLVGWQVYSNHMPLLTAGQLPEYTTSSGAWGKVIASNFCPETAVYLPMATRQQVTVTNGGGARVSSANVTAHKISAQIEASTPSMVVLSQSYYHRWKAFVDGKPAKLWRANYAFQALQVPAGNHQIEIIYRDAAFIVGVAIALVTGTGVIFGWLILSRRQLNPSGTPHELATSRPLNPDS